MTLFNGFVNGLRDFRNITGNLRPIFAKRQFGVFANQKDTEVHRSTEMISGT